MTSTSQAWQDIFAYEMCGHKTDGTFLDVGSYNVVCCNNSYGLERIGWRGLMVDVFRHTEALPRRTSPFLQADATKIDWLAEIGKAGLPRTIDYLSLDVDEATLATLMSMPLSVLKFNVITVEHDAYKLGNGPRDMMRGILAGYDLVCSDVLIDGFGPFEDWYVDRKLSEKADRFRSHQKRFQEIIKHP